MGMQLPDDIGEWVCDGVVLCEVVNKLHPGLITKPITKPNPGEVGIYTCMYQGSCLYMYMYIHVY